MPNKYRFLSFILLLLFVVFLSVGYSAFGNDMMISDIASNVRLYSDIRVTSVNIDSSNNGGISNYEDYNVSLISGNIDLPNEDSSVIYRVSVTNFGSIDMGIFDITGLPNNLDMDIDGYGLKDKICNSNGDCNLGITRDFYITIKYRLDDDGNSLYDSSNINYDIRLDFDFREMLNINYIGFIDYSLYPSFVILDDDLNIVFNSIIDDIAIRIGGVIVDSSSYSFDGYNLIINNVSEDIDIINLDGSTFLSGIEFNYLIKNGEYAPEGDVEEYYNVDANRLVDHTVKKIIFGKTADYIDEVNDLVAEPIDVYRTGMINLYREKDSDGKFIIYILSKNGEFILNENASWTFDKLYDLEEIVNLHLLDTSNVVKMRDMFCDCASIKNLDLSNFDTSKVTNMVGMFARMTELEYLDLSSFDTSNLTIMNQMFTTDPILKKIYVSDKWQITEKLEEGTGVFTACDSLVGGNGTVLGTDITYKMAVVDTASSSGYLTNGYKFLPGLKFNHIIKNLSQTQIDAWSTSNRYSNEDIASIVFGRIRDYSEIVDDYTGIAVDNDESGVINAYRVLNNDGTYSVYVLSNSGNFIVNEDASWMFDKILLMEEIVNLDLLDTSKVVNMRDMFCDCQYLKSLDLSKFNTINATSFEGMFARMYMIEELDLSNFNTVNLTSLKNTFSYGISSTDTHSSLMSVTPALRKIYVSNKWNTSKVTLTDGTFSNCVNLVGGNGTVFNSSNLTASYARADVAGSPGYFTMK